MNIFLFVHIVAWIKALVNNNISTVLSFFIFPVFNVVSFLPLYYSMHLDKDYLGNFILDVF